MHGKQLVAVFFSIILLSGVTSTFSPSSAYATGNDKPIFGVWFVTSADKCSDRNIEAMEHYRSVTYQFLNKYKINHDYPVAQCIDVDILPELVDKYSQSYDLLIIIPDIWNSLKWLVSKNRGGHYYYNGQTNIIVSEAVSPYVESKSATWILSHELSHFALAWKGYSSDVYVQGVHTLQSSYDRCISEDSTGAFCPQLWTTIQTKNGKSFHVMEPIFPSTTSTSTPTTTGKAETLITHFKTPTMIVDNGYQTVNAGSDVIFSGVLYEKASNGALTPITGAPIRIADHNKFITSEKSYIPLIGNGVTDNNGKFSISWNAIKHTGFIRGDSSMWTPVVHYDGNSKYKPTEKMGNQFWVKDLPKVQPVLDSDNDGILDNVDSCKYSAETFNDYQDSDGCPDTKPLEQLVSGGMGGSSGGVTMEFVTNDGKLFMNNLEYTLPESGLLLIKIFGDVEGTWQHEGEEVRIYVKYPNDTVIAYKTTVSNGGFSIIERLGANSPSGFYTATGGYADQVSKWGDGSFNPVTFVVKDIEPSQKTFKVAAEPSTTYSTAQQDLDKAKGLKPLYQNKIEVLQTGIKTAERSLSNLQYGSPEALKKIDDAWSVRWMAIEKLDSAREYFDLAETNLGNGNFKKSLYWYDEIDVSSNSIEDDLKWISKAIADAEKLEEEYKSQGFLAFAFNSEEGKNCIWFICW